MPSLAVSYSAAAGSEAQGTEPDMMDDLLSATALPPTEPLRSAPLTTKRLQPGEARTPIWIVIGLGNWSRGHGLSSAC